MKLKRVFRENWMTRAPNPSAFPITVALVLALVAGSVGGAPASRDLVFHHGEYWRAWTALFAHAGLEHLLSNLFLFIPFAYLLSAYFAPLFFPIAGFFVGGLVNLAVLQTMPGPVFLVGASGLVYWMGAAWITLGLLVDRRDRLPRRILKALGVSLLIFIPETYRPEVSYLAHFLGYFSGVASALVYYGIARKQFRRAERYDFVWDLDALWDPEINGYSLDLLEEEAESEPR